MDMYNVTLVMNLSETTAVPAVADSTYPLYVGFLTAALSVLIFGSNFIPVKKFETGDGLFFQWILCSAIWTAGLCSTAISGFPQFQPLAMLGGFLWSTGNLMTVPIIKTIGLGQGLLVWASVCMLSGWACGRFGWFGLHSLDISQSTLNYLGICLCLVSTVLVIQIKSDSKLSLRESDPIDATSGDRVRVSLIHSKKTELSVDNTTDEPSYFEKMSQFKRRAMGIAMAVVAGWLFGQHLTPVTYIKQNVEGASQKDMDYVFAHFSGIFITSTVYFMVYCAVMKNRPKIYQQAILPAYVSGLMWGVADIAWFVTNDVLSQTISFPIISSGPPLIAAMWGVYFKEIRGVRNTVILILAGCVNISGTVLTAISL